MPAPEIVTLHMIRSFVRNEDDIPRHVDGMTRADGTTLKQYYGLYAPGEGFEPMELALPAVLADRFTDFFDRHIARRGWAYNCHSFALAMAGVEVPTDLRSDFTEIVEPMIEESSPHTGALGLGQMGVIAHRMGGSVRAVHSVIGLGADSTQCLQVRGTGGELTVDSYDRTNDAYLPYNGIPYPGHGMYAVEAR